MRYPALACVVMSTVGLPLSAATFQVNTVDDGVDTNLADGICNTALNACSLRAAIQTANANPGPDTIRLPAGTYNLVLPGNEDSSAGGDLNPNGQLEIIGEGADKTLIVQGIGGQSVFRLVFNLSSTLLMQGVTLAGGNASNGGALLIQGATNGTSRGAILTECHLWGNTATFNGGAIYNSGSLELHRCTLSENRAEKGGGIFNLGSLFVANCTFARNSATVDGGGLFMYGGNAVIESSTISENVADSDSNGTGNGAGIHVNGGGVSLHNTIVFGNIDRGIPMFNDLSGTILSQGFNIFGDINGGSGFANNDLLVVNPMLGPLEFNGKTLSYPLLSGSPAIDAGQSVLAEDQRGVTRPQGAADDIGAVEMVPETNNPGDPNDPGTTNTSDDNTNGTPNTPDNGQGTGGDNEVEEEDDLPVAPAACGVGTGVPLMMLAGGWLMLNSHRRRR